MNVEVVELDDRKAKFVLSGVTHAFANSLRRGMLAEIPTLAIDYVNIYDNTSVLFDEQLALRLGLIPLATDLDSYVLPSDCGCGGEGCPAKWQAGIACGYKNIPRITVSEECDACGMCVDACPRGVLVIADEAVKVVDERACSLCRLCESVCEIDWIKVETYPDSVIFTAESDTELIIRSADNIKERATALDEYLGIIDA